MMVRLLGAVLIIAGSGGFGFMLSAEERKLIRYLDQMERLLYEIEWELQYRLTPLPQLCIHASRAVRGELKAIFSDLGERLKLQTEPDVESCMNGVLQFYDKRLPRQVRQILCEMGYTLGRFGFEEQLEGLRLLRNNCREISKSRKNNLSERMRGARTLILCTAAALIIVLV